MLARRLAIMLPAMRLAEALETTRIHRVAGLTGGRYGQPTIRERGPIPVRALNMRNRCAGNGDAQRGA
jgi:hypothetical protein